jgi:hypothetical protein
MEIYEALEDVFARFSGLCAGLSFLHHEEAEDGVGSVLAVLDDAETIDDVLAWLRSTDYQKAGTYGWPGCTGDQPKLNGDTVTWRSPWPDTRYSARAVVVDNLGGSLVVRITVEA